MTPEEQQKQRALATVRGYCGWHVSPCQGETLYCDVMHKSPFVYLPTCRIVGVHSVRFVHASAWHDVPLRDVSHTGISWSKSGVLEWRAGKFPAGFQAVEVALTHGFTEEEAGDFWAVVDAVKDRIGDLGRIKAQSVNGASVTYFTDSKGAGASIGLFESEKEALNRYRIRGELAW